MFNCATIKKMESQQIIQQIELLFEATDARDWDHVEKSMDEQVLLDYSSMNGNPPAMLGALEIVTAWSAFLPGFDSTHHQLSDFIVKKAAHIATAHFDGHANHCLDGDVWTVQGSYDLKLRQANNRWLVTEFKFNFAKQSGNTELPNLATQRVSNKK
jgi:hypothetical protein